MLFLDEVRHVLEEMAPELVGKSKAQSHGAVAPQRVDESELRVLALLDDAPVGVDRLVETLGASVGDLTFRLAKLEVRGLVCRGGSGYEITGRGATAREVALGHAAAEAIDG